MGVMSFLIMESLGPFLSWNSPLMPPTFCVAIVIGGSVCTGCGGGEGERVGEVMDEEMVEG